MVTATGPGTESTSSPLLLPLKDLLQALSLSLSLFRSLSHTQAYVCVYTHAHTVIHIQDYTLYTLLLLYIPYSCINILHVYPTESLPAEAPGKPRIALQLTHAGEGVEGREPSHMVGGNARCAATTETSVKVPQKTKTRIIVRSRSRAPGHIPGQDHNSNRYMRPYVHSSAVRNRQVTRHPEGPSPDGQIQMPWCLLGRHPRKPELRDAPQC